MDKEIQELQQRVMREVCNRVSDATKATQAIRIGDMNCVYMAAGMDVKQTANSLKQVLEYKKKLALGMLKCTDIDQVEEFLDALLYSDEIIKQLLGMGKYKDNLWK